MKNKKRRLAYIAKDTKTYMNLEEARYTYSKEGDENILFILIPKYINANLTKRIQETVKDRLWDEIVWIYTWSNSISSSQKAKKRRNKLYSLYWDLREFLFNYLDRKKLDSVAKKYRPTEYVFSAHKNTQEHLAAKLNPKKLYLVDSGHRIFKRINNDGFIDYSRSFIARSRFSRYMYWSTGLKVYDREKTTLFTVYSDEIETNHKVEKNDFSFQNYQLSSKPIGEDVVWISTPIYAMVEDGVKIEDYVSYIESYLNHLQINRDKLVYIPHPGKQTDQEIEYIRQKLNCRIDDRDIPVEFKISNYDELPGLCISPFSSALVNISMASGGRVSILSAWHYEFNYFKLWLNWRKDVEKNDSIDVKFLEVEDAPPLFRIGKDAENGDPPYTRFSDWEKKTYNAS